MNLFTATARIVSATVSEALHVLFPPNDIQVSAAERALNAFEAVNDGIPEPEDMQPDVGFAWGCTPDTADLNGDFEVERSLKDIELAQAHRKLARYRLALEAAGQPIPE